MRRSAGSLASLRQLLAIVVVDDHAEPQALVGNVGEAVHSEARYLAAADVDRDLGLAIGLGEQGPPVALRGPAGAGRDIQRAVLDLPQDPRPGQLRPARPRSRSPRRSLRSGRCRRRSPRPCRRRRCRARRAPTRRGACKAPPPGPERRQRGPPRQGKRRSPIPSATPPSGFASACALRPDSTRHSSASHVHGDTPARRCGQRLRSEVGGAVGAGTAAGMAERRQGCHSRSKAAGGLTQHAKLPPGQIAPKDLLGHAGMCRQSASRRASTAGLEPWLEVLEECLDAGGVGAEIAEADAGAERMSSRLPAPSGLTRTTTSSLKPHQSVVSRRLDPAVGRRRRRRSPSPILGRRRAPARRSAPAAGAPRAAGCRDRRRAAAPRPPRRHSRAGWARRRAAAGSRRTPAGLRCRS